VGAKIFIRRSQRDASLRTFSVRGPVQNPSEGSIACVSRRSDDRRKKDFDQSALMETGAPHSGATKRYRTGGGKS
jgi:hypothetical protein